MLPSKLAFVDIETTGMRSFYDRIIEIAILRVEENKIVSTFHSLINPEAHLPPEITLLTGITAGDLENAPTFRSIKDDILETLSDCIFVAHNVRFDYGFIKNEFKRLDLSFSSRHFCTVRLSRTLYPQHSHHNLDSIINRFDFTFKNAVDTHTCHPEQSVDSFMRRHAEPNPPVRNASNLDFPRHRALYDAKILYMFYKKIIHEFPHDQIENAIGKSLKKPSIPIKLQTDLETLPEGPGVYIFYGESGAPLYIGKSINLKERILSHFSADLRSPTEMKISQQVVSIETIETAGELGALLLESQMIKKILPLYNKKSRFKRELIALRKKTNKEGYNILKMEVAQLDVVARPQRSRGRKELACLTGAKPACERSETGACDEAIPSDFDSILGIFKSRQQAKSFLSDIAKNYSLCEILLGLEKTKNACFAYRLEKCKGACIHKEKPIRYNMRFAQAFASSKIKPWPFSGTIVIEESNINKTDYFLINNWCYIDSTQNYTFDLDIYNILRQFLSHPRNYKKIRLLQNSRSEVIDSL